MAKKSAKSKGYRKTAKQQANITKKDLIITGAIIAAIILIVVLFNLLYDDGFLKAKDVQPNDVVTYASSDLRDRYAKVATANELEGFTMEAVTSEGSPIATYTYTPNDEASPITNITLTGSVVAYDSLVDTTVNYATALGATPTEKHEVEVQGRPGYVYSYTYDYYSEDNATEEEAAAAAALPEGEIAPSNTFGQSVSCYVQADESHTVCLHIYHEGEDDSHYMPAEEILDYALGFTGAFTVVETK